MRPPLRHFFFRPEDLYHERMYQEPIYDIAHIIPLLDTDVFCPHCREG